MWLKWCYCHFFILCIIHNDIVVFQAYANNYLPRINSWNTWKEDLYDIVHFNKNVVFTKETMNDFTNNTTRTDQWRKIFDTKFVHHKDSVYQLSVYIHF
jgi:hypothetical protein